jgi:hypothetical protein
MSLAVEVSTWYISSGVSGLRPKADHTACINATTPVTCGAAMEVPDI